MANLKISELIQRTPDGTEFLEVIIPPFSPGSNRKVLLQDILDIAGGGTVTSVTGTTNRITSTGGATPVIDIDPAYDAAIAASLALKAPITGYRTFPVKCGDDVTPIGVATLFTFRMPYAMTLTGIRAGLTTAQASGSIITFDVREAGVSILSTLITIDNTEKTSVSAAAQPVISDASLADDAEITILCTQIGNGSAIGPQITFIGS